jgi:hypothetical protein
VVKTYQANMYAVPRRSQPVPANPIVPPSPQHSSDSVGQDTSTTPESQVHLVGASPSQDNGNGSVLSPIYIHDDRNNDIKQETPTSRHHSSLAFLNSDHNNTNTSINQPTSALLSSDRAQQLAVAATLHQAIQSKSRPADSAAPENGQNANWRKRKRNRQSIVPRQCHICNRVYRYEKPHFARHHPGMELPGGLEDEYVADTADYDEDEEEYKATARPSTGVRDSWMGSSTDSARRWCSACTAQVSNWEEHQRTHHDGDFKVPPNNNNGFKAVNTPSTKLAPRKSTGGYRPRTMRSQLDEPRASASASASTRLAPNGRAPTTSPITPYTQQLQDARRPSQASRPTPQEDPFEKLIRIIQQMPELPPTRKAVLLEKVVLEQLKNISAPARHIQASDDAFRQQIANIADISRIAAAETQTQTQPRTTGRGRGRRAIKSESSPPPAPVPPFHHEMEGQADADADGDDDDDDAIHDAMDDSDDDLLRGR